MADPSSVAAVRRVSWVECYRTARAAGRAGDAEARSGDAALAPCRGRAGDEIQRATERLRRGTPGPEGSIAKLQMAEGNKAIYDLSAELLGQEALLYRGYEETRPDAAAVHGGSGDVRYDYLRSLANSIEGGTSEILRNVLGERVLGLPR